jgi:hypothetical protein
LKAASKNTKSLSRLISLTKRMKRARMKTKKRILMSPRAKSRALFINYLESLAIRHSLSSLKPRTKVLTARITNR